MNKKFIVLFIGFITISFSCFSQHNFKAGCRLSKDHRPGHIECQGCVAELEKERQARMAEDKRRAAERTAKEKAEQDAREAALKAEQERKKNQPALQEVKVPTAGLNSGNNTAGGMTLAAENERKAALSSKTKLIKKKDPKKEYFYGFVDEKRQNYWIIEPKYFQGGGIMLD